MTLPLFLLWAGQIASEPKVTMGELRSWVPEELRPAASGSNLGWALAVKASQRATSTTTNQWKPGLPPSMGALPTRQPDNPKSLLMDWGKLSPTASLLARSRKVLTTYQGQMATMRKALAYPTWTPPRRSDRAIPADTDVEILFPQYSGMKELTSAFVLQAQVHLAEKNYVAAESDLLDAWSLADHTCRNGGSIIGFLVGIAEGSIVQSNIFRMAKDGSLPTGTVLRFQRLYSQSELRKQLAENLRSEFDGFALHAIGTYPDPAVKPYFFELRDEDSKVLLQGHPHPFDRKQTVAWFADIFRSRIDNLGRPWASQIDVEKKFRPLYDGLPSLLEEKEMLEEDEKPTPTTAELLSAQSTLRGIDNPVGRYLVGELAGGRMEMTSVAFRSEARNRQTALAFGAIVFKRRTGKWPASLDVLSARDGIDRKLIDPFTDKPFRYDSRNLVISSAGPYKTYGGKEAPKISLKK